MIILVNAVIISSTDGKIVKSGDASLALEVEKSGYAFLGKAYEESEA